MKQDSIFLFSINQQMRFLPFEETPLPSSSPLSWLSSQLEYPKFYFREKNSTTIRAAAGMTLSLPSPPVISGPCEIRFYGGQHFFPSLPRKDLSWSSFPSQLYWLPKLEYSFTNDLSTLRTYKASPLSRPQSFPSCAQEGFFPSYEEWKKNVQGVLEQIQKKQLEKVVLARKHSRNKETPLDPFSFLSHLQEKYPSHTLFLVQFDQTTLFMGASPEMLYSRKGCAVKIDALAGTRRDPACFSSKEKEEFLTVKEGISSLIKPLAQHCHFIGEDQVISAGSSLYHLYNQLIATILPHVSDTTLLSLLHPTPALGGKPRDAALQFIYEKEPFDRGWYGAPLGVVSNDAASFCVAIRSALIGDGQTHLFSGAGIVKGSDPYDEWAELNHKLAWFQTPLEGGS